MNTFKIVEPVKLLVVNFLFLPVQNVAPRVLTLFIRKKSHGGVRLVRRWNNSYKVHGCQNFAYFYRYEEISFRATILAFFKGYRETESLGLTRRKI